MNFSIDVTNKVAVPVNPPEIVCGNSDYVIDFTFDSEWDMYGIKTAIFTYKRNGQVKFIEIVFEGTRCNMPVLSGIDEVSIGVYAGQLKTTTPAMLVCKKSALCDVTKHEDPPYDVYTQFLQIANDNYTVAAVTELKKELSDFKTETQKDISTMRETTDKAFEEMEKTIPPHAQIIVTTRGGTVSCIHESGQEIEGVKFGNVWTFEAPEYGVYTIVGNYQTLTQEKTVTVTAVEQHCETLEFYSDNFADNDWQTIIEVIERGISPDSWNVGDTKVLENVGNSYYSPRTGASPKISVRIIGKNHDTYTDGGIAPFTFCIVPIGTSANNDIVIKPMSSTGNNAGGWESSKMRTVVIPNSFISALPEYIANALKSVKKYTSEGGMSSVIEQTEDRAFLLSEVEIHGTTTKSFEGEGTQYEFYRNGNTDGATDYWLRSPYKDDEQCFLRRDINNVLQNYLPNSELCYFPAFCF